MTITTHLNYTITTNPGLALKVHNTSKYHTFVLPSSFKGHLTLNLIQSIEALCDKHRGQYSTIFYTFEFYANFTGLEQGRILRNICESDIERLVDSISHNVIPNKEVDEKLIQRLARGKFSTPEQVKKISELLDRGASEQIINESTAVEKKIDEFKFAFELKLDRNGYDVDADRRLFMQRTSASTFLNHKNKFPFGKGEYNLSRYLAYQFLNSSDVNELRDKIEECKKLINLDYLRSEFALIIAESSDPILVEALANSKKLKDFAKLSDLANDRLEPKILEKLKNKPFYLLREFAVSLLEAILDLSSSLKIDSHLTDTVIVVDQECFYANSILLAFQSGYFERSQGYYFERDKQGRRIYDLTEECLDPNIFFLLNYMLGRCSLNFQNDAFRYLLLKASEFFDNQIVLDSIRFNPNLERMVDENLERFGTKNFDGIIEFLEVRSEQDRVNAIIIVFDIFFPGLTSLLGNYGVFELLKYCRCFREVDTNYTVSSFPLLLDKLRRVFHNNFIEVEPLIAYFLTQILCLDASEFIPYAKIVSNELKNTKVKSLVQKSFLSRINQDSNLQKIPIVLDDKTYLTRGNYLILFAGALIAKQLLNQGFVDLSTALAHNPKLIEIIKCEVFLDGKISWPEDLRGKYELGKLYEFLGIEIPMTFTIIEQTIMNLYMSKDFVGLYQFLRENNLESSFRNNFRFVVHKDLREGRCQAENIKELIEIIEKDWCLSLTSWLRLGL